MRKIVGVGFKDVGKVYWFNPEPFQLKLGKMVVVETIRGLELGKIVEPIREVEDSEIERELKDIIRPATEKDIQNFIDNERKAIEAIDVIKEIVEEHELEMKVVGCEYTLDGAKLLIYYNAEGRVDFRELVKSLAASLRVRIELRQIGPREGAKFLGGIGSCGREICCSKHLREFDLVTMKMAKDQNMTLSSNKITGLCGKLMCCIGYEADVYADARKRLPNVGDTVDTPNCKNCEVVNVDYLREIVTLKKDDTLEQVEGTKVSNFRRIKEKEEEIEAFDESILDEVIEKPKAKDKPKHQDYKAKENNKVSNDGFKKDNKEQHKQKNFNKKPKDNKDINQNSTQSNNDNIRVIDCKKMFFNNKNKQHKNNNRNKNNNQNKENK